MFNLIKNEQIKIFIQKSTWIMFACLFAYIIVFAILANTFEKAPEYKDDQWQAQITKEIKELEKDLSDAEDETYSNWLSEQIAIKQYHIDNNIKPNEFNMWSFVNSNKDSLSLVSLLTIITAAGMIANEFRWGTIKLLLIRPISRTKILLSKYLSLLLFSTIALLFVLIVSTIIGGAIFGFGSLTEKIVVLTKDGIETQSIISQIASGYGYKLVNLLMMATFAFMISAIFRNSSIAVGLGIFLMMAGNGILLFLSERSWAKYILFANTDLEQYATGQIMFDGMTLGFSITVLMVYYLIFMGLSWFFFTRRDVAGA